MSNNKTKLCAVILTALPQEYQAVRAHLTNVREEVHPQGTIYEQGIFSSRGRSWHVGIVEIGAGNPGAAFEAERAISHFEPSLVLFVGVAGGLKDVKLGDVVAATKVYGYESGKVTTTFHPRPNVGNSTYPLQQRARAEARKTDWLRRLEGPIPVPTPRVFIAPLAAGEKVLASNRSVVRKLLKSLYGDAVAVEMEGFGFLQAAHANPQVDALVIRGISDLIDDKRETDAANSQEIAARHASAFAFEILAKMQPSAPRQTGYLSIAEKPSMPHPTSIQRREQVVKEIYGRLIQSGTTAIVLTGMVGIGKSTLATLVYHYAEQQRLSGSGPFTDEAIWLSVDPTVTLTDLAASLFVELGKPLPDFSSLPPQNQASVFFNVLNTTASPRLVVLDQFENLLEPQTGQVLAERPGIGDWLDALNSHPCSCRVLLTSRLWPQGTREYPLSYMQEYFSSGLQESEAIELLRNQGAGAEETEAELHTASVRCGGHALALVLLASLLRRNRSLSITDLFNDPLYAQLWTGNIAANILDYIYMHQLNQVQRQLLLAFSIYREAVPLGAAETIVNAPSRVPPKQLLSALDVLLAQHLLEARGKLCYHLHPIVSAYAQDHFAESNEQANQQAQRAAHAVAAHYYQQQVATSCLPRAQRQRISDVHDLIETVWHQCQAEQWQTAYELMAQEDLFADLRRWGGDTILLGLYKLFLPLDKWEPQSWQVERIYSELGEIYNALGQKEQARKYFEKALPFFQEGGDHSREAKALNNLGMVANSLGQLEQAVTYHQHALRICLEAEDHSEEGIALNNLGAVYEALDEQKLARTCYEQALYLHRETGNRDEEARTLNNLGSMYQIEGEPGEAKAYFEQALRTFREVGNRREEGTTLNNLGVVSRALGDITKAREYFEQALYIFGEVGDRWREGSALNNLGMACRVLGKRDEARVYYGQSLRLHRELGDLNGESTTLSNLGMLYLTHNRSDVALACFVLARDIFEKLRSPGSDRAKQWVASLRKQASDEQFEVLQVESRALQVLEQALHEEIEGDHHQ